MKNLRNIGDKHSTLLEIPDSRTSQKSSKTSRPLVMSPMSFTSTPKVVGATWWCGWIGAPRPYHCVGGCMANLDQAGLDHRLGHWCDS